MLKSLCRGLLGLYNLNNYRWWQELKYLYALNQLYFCISKIVVDNLVLTSADLQPFVSNAGWLAYIIMTMKSNEGPISCTAVQQGRQVASLYRGADLTTWQGT